MEACVRQRRSPFKFLVLALLALVLAVACEGQAGTSSSTPSGSTTTAALSLTVQAPADGAIVAANTVNVTGKAAAGSNVAVNGTPATVQADGSFAAQVTLEEGANLIEVSATDENEDQVDRQLVVYYTAAP